MNLRELVISLTANADKFRQEVDSAMQGAQKSAQGAAKSVDQTLDNTGKRLEQTGKRGWQMFSKQGQQAANDVGRAMNQLMTGVLAPLFSAMQFKNFIVGSNSALKQINDLGVQFNISAKRVSAFEDALASAGVKSDVALGHMRRLSQGLRDARFMRGPLVQAAMYGGVSLRGLRDPNGGVRTEQYMVNLAQRIQGLSRERSQRVLQMAGIQDTETMQFLGQGADKVKEAFQAAYRETKVTQDMAKGAQEAAKQWTQLAHSFQRTRTELYAQLLPLLNKTLKWVNDFLVKGDRMQYLLKAIAVITGGILVNSIGKLTISLMKLIASPIGAFVASLTALYLLFDDISTWSEGGISRFGNIYDELFGDKDEFKQKLDGFKEGAVSFVRDLKDEFSSLGSVIAPIVGALAGFAIGGIPGMIAGGVGGFMFSSIMSSKPAEAATAFKGMEEQKGVDGLKGKVKEYRSLMNDWGTGKTSKDDAAKALKGKFDEINKVIDENGIKPTPEFQEFKDGLRQVADIASASPPQETVFSAIRGQAETARSSVKDLLSACLQTVAVVGGAGIGAKVGGIVGGPLGALLGGGLGAAVAKWGHDLYEDYKMTPEERIADTQKRYVKYHQDETDPTGEELKNLSAAQLQARGLFKDFDTGRITDIDGNVIYAPKLIPDIEGTEQYAEEQARERDTGVYRARTELIPDIEDAEQYAGGQARERDTKVRRRRLRAHAEIIPKLDISDSLDGGWKAGSAEEPRGIRVLPPLKKKDDGALDYDASGEPRERRSTEVDDALLAAVRDALGSGSDNPSAQVIKDAQTARVEREIAPVVTDNSTKSITVTVESELSDETRANATKTLKTAGDMLGIGYSRADIVSNYNVGIGGAE